MRRNLLATAKLLTAFFLFFTWSCTKIDTTTLGNDLIPAVDNVHTFADTLAITGTQGFFSDDSTRISSSDFHPLGVITNDPVFGTTNADLYLQLKPAYFPFYFGNAGDTIANVINPGADATGFDSAVLCLSFKTFYGDTLTPQTLSVYQLDNNVTNFKNGTFIQDSSIRIDFRPDAEAGETFLGRATIAPPTVRDFTFFKGSKKDSVNNQLRIKLEPGFLQYLINNRDSSANGTYHSDSLFKSKIKGFKIKAEQGNGLFYVALDEAATRLEIHYKKIKNNVRDTSYSAFYFSTGTVYPSSAQATNIKRNWDGYELKTPQPEVLYIQSAPGTYANLSIPGLAAFQNSIIHRAEIVVDAIPSADPSDKVMLPPSYLYLDLANDSGTVPGSKFKPVYFDLNPLVNYNPDNLGSIYSLFVGTGVDYDHFGGKLRVKDTGSVARYYYDFDVSRHVQHIVTNDVNNYNFRLYAPFRLNYYGTAFPFRNLLADGRVRVGNGNHPQYKMYMRIVYSKL